MPLAPRLKNYLDEAGIAYDLQEHRETSSSESTADASHIPGDSLAKGVVVKGGEGYLLVVLPASRNVELNALADWLGQRVELAREDEITVLFPDCALGAVPPVGAAYGLKTAIDENLDAQKEVYLEGGDHRTLVRLAAAQFRELTHAVPHQRFSTRLRKGPG